MLDEVVRRKSSRLSDKIIDQEYDLEFKVPAFPKHKMVGVKCSVQVQHKCDVQVLADKNTGTAQNWKKDLTIQFNSSWKVFKYCKNI